MNVIRARFGVSGLALACVVGCLALWSARTVPLLNRSEAAQVAGDAGLISRVEQLNDAVSKITTTHYVGKNGVVAYKLIGDTMIQWGIGTTVPKTYAAQAFVPPFDSMPTVTASVLNDDLAGAFQNDVYSNISQVTANKFDLIGLRQGSADIPARGFHWIAIGKAKRDDNDKSRK